jgi:hypothetical protein
MIRSVGGRRKAGSGAPILHAEMPRFWRREAVSYRLRLVDREVPMPWNWPVEVNYLEAKAFCNWKAAQPGLTRSLADRGRVGPFAGSNISQDQPDWEQAPGNINLEHYASSCPCYTGSPSARSMM